jgi:hypothetical protein
MMKLTDITKKFTTEDKCLDYLEQMRWPNGDLCCIRCGVLNVSKIIREAGKNKRVRAPSRPTPRAETQTGDPG